VPINVQHGSIFAQKIWGTTLTLATECQCVCSHLYGKKPTSIIQVGNRADISLQGNNRASEIQEWFGDRYRGSALKPKALGATAFGQETAQRPKFSQTLSMQGQELTTAGFENLEVGQTYTNIPIERSELQAAGAEAAEIISRSVYAHLAGDTSYNSSWDVPPCGNTVRELDASHRFWCNGKTSDALVAADSASILTMEFLERVLTKLLSRSHVYNPYSVPDTPWGNWFPFICDAEGAEQLTRHSSTNRVMSLTLAEIQGGNATDKVASFMQANTGFAGTRRILVLVDDYTPFGVDGTTSDATTAGTQIGNVRRGMLLAPLAMWLRWGEHFDADSNHIMATKHREYLHESHKLFTHWGGLATRIGTSTGGTAVNQRWGSATIGYYVEAASVP
jgi:hypothetical protein